MGKKKRSNKFDNYCRITVKYKMCPSEGQYQDIIKLQTLRDNVGYIARICITLQVILFCMVIIPYSINSLGDAIDPPEGSQIENYTDTTKLIAATIWVITTSASVALYIGAKQKKRYLLVPFMILIGLFQGYCLINAVLFLLSSWRYIIKAIHHPKLFIPFIFVIAFNFLLFMIQKPAKNLYVELGKETPQLSILQPHLSYSPRTGLSYSGVYQRTPGVRSTENILTSNFVRSNGDTNQSSSGLHVDLPIHTPSIPSERVGASALGEDCLPAYCETNHSNNVTNIEPPPSYDDAMKKLEAV